MADSLKIQAADNVAVALRDLAVGELVENVIIKEAIATGHKFALQDIAQNTNVLKYGYPIGHATAPITAGSWVHTHNLATNLDKQLAYTYQPQQLENKTLDMVSFMGYPRANGQVGVRNELWIIPTVGCVNQSARLIAEQINQEYAHLANFDGAVPLIHPYGCSQLGEDHLRTRKILANLAKHPNAGGVLILGLGCENNTIAEFKQELQADQPENLSFLVAQEVEDEISSGLELARQLVAKMLGQQRTACPISKLTIGLKCGGSDAFSGITANPLVGAVSDQHIARGGATILTEVPEMFGAEQLLMARAKDEVTFAKTVDLINNFKAYYEQHQQPIYENPSPGNKAGGISTLEEKSLGCVQKGGRSALVDVLDYVERVRTTGLSLLNGPGNDIVACTVLASAGCQIILFTTGRGTPLGTVVPTLKIATNSNIFQKKQNWLDFNAGKLLETASMESLSQELYQDILAVASGKQCKAEKMGYREISIFKTGVTL
ncbi:UxaA family hydrolase [Succinispira mobilis]|uniref:UxaA family hydrolase n=1 Tax=Succinispira mobilis TaxID=78120 RepID=UPI000379BFC8|nr:altronate dehydratase family protein [Succinispira mobilis]